MNKAKLKKFAIYSREKLIEDIKNKSMLIGITEEGINSPLSESTQDMLVFDIGEIETHKIYGQDVRKYKKLTIELEKKQEETDYKTAYKVLIEEIAYTWFNRIIAIRFMEVNNYMPDKLRILSSGKEGVKEPEFITHYRDTDIGITNEEFEKLDELKLDGSSKAMEDIFQFLFIKQCNKLNEILPELFEKTNDYSELLLNISYNDPDGIIYKLIEDIGEEPFNISKTGQIEIIGWLYQYYNTAPKAEVDKAVKKGKKVDENTIPAKTQLFTPEWIVKYMVENSLGRLWIEKKISQGTDKTEEGLAKSYNWKYYLPEAKQIEEVDIKLKNLRQDRKNLKVEDIKFIDPSMGSGHILVYAFDMFMQFYLEEGYTEREAVKSIIEENLYGLEIDERAYQLSYFSLMMKGRKHSRRILNKDISNNLHYFIDSKDIKKEKINYLGSNINDPESLEEHRSEIIEILDLFKNARELGSIIRIKKKYNYNLLIEFVKNINMKNALPMELVDIEDTQNDIINILELAEILSSKYEIVVTNPPYLSNSDTNGEFKEYQNKEYKNTKSDLFAIFMEKCDELLNIVGYYGMINQHSWMFLSSFSKYREEIISNNNIINMLHLGPRTFEEIGGEVVQSTTFIMNKNKTHNYKGSYIRLTDFKNALEKENKALESINNHKCRYYYETNEEDFKLIPGSPIAYWASKKIFKVFKGENTLKTYSDVKLGLSPGKTNLFLKHWHEVNNYFKKNHLLSRTQAENTKLKWFPCNKGGAFRKWFGNNEYYINWKYDGKEIRNLKDKLGKLISRPQNLNYQFKEHIGYSRITSSETSFRYYPNGTLFTDSSSGIFSNNKNYMLGYLNTKIPREILKILNPTLNFQAGNIKDIPLIFSKTYKSEINSLVKQNISISKTDWDSFETSWDFEIHPLLDEEKQEDIPNTIELSYENWKSYANSNFSKLKENEERLNEIFIDIYELEDELTPEVSDKDITIAKIFDNKNEIYDDIKGNKYILTKEDVIKSFISYGVGCIFGRYSLNEKGLIYAGGEFDIDKYNKFKPVEDNIVLITDQEYFEDDLVNRFIEFVKISFGEENLEENLNFIANSLKGKGTSREKIRNYFIKDFYKDHVQTYKKRPIYWLYDSGKKQNAFKALIYMHRYDEDTTGKVRIDYLHELQKVYERKVDFLRDDILNNKDAKEVSRSEKELNKITKQIKECKDYDEKIAHIALLRIPIDLDDGVKVNYEKVQTDDEGNKYKILAEI